MGFNKYYVPEPAKLVGILRRDGVRAFFNRKIDAMIGDSNSMRILDDAYALVRQDVEDTKILEIIEEQYGQHLKESTN
jgi:hypothetical protein